MAHIEFKEAVYRIYRACMHGDEGEVTISIDALGPKMTFKSDHSGNEHVLTTDDALNCNGFIGSSFDLQEEFRRVCDADFAFEAGLGFRYDGDMYVKHFMTLDGACKYANELFDQYADELYMDAEVYCRAIELL